VRSFALLFNSVDITKDIAMPIRLAVLALCVMWGTGAVGHEMGRWGGSGQFLYGYNRLTKTEGSNCCTFGGLGDCQEYPAEKVKIVEGGYLLEDGEFIAQWDTSVSPLDSDGEYRFYRCQHPGKLTHCFQVPPSGS
jgi:hypothetical protein